MTTIYADRPATKNNPVTVEHVKQMEWLSVVPRKYNPPAFEPSGPYNTAISGAEFYLILEGLGISFEGFAAATGNPATSVKYWTRQDGIPIAAAIAVRDIQRLPAGLRLGSTGILVAHVHCPRRGDGRVDERELPARLKAGNTAPRPAAVLYVNGGASCAHSAPTRWERNACNNMRAAARGRTRDDVSVCRHTCAHPLCLGLACGTSALYSALHLAPCWRE